MAIYGMVAIRSPWNSDFMSMILVVKELFRSKVYLSPDTFLIKYPIVWLVSAFVEYGRKYMWLLQMANGAVMIAGFGWYFADYAGRFVSKKMTGAAVAAGLFYMATMSAAFFGFTVHPFLRNAEIALMLLFLMVFRKSKLWSLPILIIMLLNDAYFTFVFVIPLAVCEIIGASIKKKDLSVSRGFGLLAAGTVLTYFLRDRIINRTPYFLIYEEIAAFRDWNSVGTTISLMLQGLIDLTGANFFEQKFYTSMALTAVMGGGLAILAVVGLVKLFVDGTKKSQVEMMLPLTSSLITIAVSLLSTRYGSREAGRYLVIICFWLPFGLLYWLQSIRNFKRLFWVLVLGIFLICAFKARTILIENRRNDFWRDNFYNLELVSFLKKNDLKYGYAGFWSSGISTFLAKEEVRVRQVGCEASRIGAQTWVVSDSWYKTDYYFGPSFILIGSYGNDRDTFIECDEKAVLKQFGEPQKVLEYEKDKIYVYDYNVAERF
jgi:hypothetical protein